VALNLPHLGPRTRKIARIAGYILLALVSFVFALQLTFPYDRVKAKAIEALSSKYDVSIRAVEPGFVPGRVYFKDMMLKTRPAKAGDDVTVFVIKELKVDLGILALLGSKASINIDATIGSGHIAGTVAFPFNGRGLSLDLEGSDLPSALLPMRDLIGLPMSGKIDFGIDLELPSEKLKTGKIGPNWQKAEGMFSFDCTSGCTFGDGKTKLKPKLQNARQQAFAEGGIEFGKINVDTMTARVDIKDGHLELTKFDTKSQDGEIHVDFDLTLAPVLDDSLVAGCLRFKGSESLAKREPKTHAALTTTGANIGPDGLFHIRLDGKFQKMGRKAQACGPAIKGGNGNGEDFSKTDDKNDRHNESVRPNLTVQPADETLRGGSGAGSANAVDPGSSNTVNPPPPVAPADPPTPAPVPTPPPGADGAGSATHNEGAGQIVPTPPGEPLPPGEGTAGAGGTGEAPPPH
jgi:type II secretion system protein N